MGRITFDSIGKKLPDRINIILSKKNLRDDKYVDLNICKSAEDALEFCEKLGANKAFIIGGRTIFDLMIGGCDELIISHLKDAYEGDKYFPQIKKDIWQATSTVHMPQFDIVTYSRKRK